MIIAWFSCGVTSAVACKIALSLYDDVQIYYIETGSGHPDNVRFISDCERWYGQPIHTIRSDKFFNVKDVLIKKLDFDPKEINRAIRFKQQYPDTKPLFLLIERQITKKDAMGMLWKAGIEIPAMYKMGYNNNNCIGCVKGGMGYWNKIRKDFPKVFDRMAKIEREVGATCLKDQSGKIFLDELSPNRGEMPEEFIPDCSLICQIEFQELLDRQVERVLKEEISINDVT
ncbi:MAG: hypothetical protein KHZ65_18505 [Phocaeicola vulgatus]|nr:hypothetical protein [Phocaeicola vulgatus]